MFSTSKQHYRRSSPDTVRVAVLRLGLVGFRSVLWLVVGLVGLRSGKAMVAPTQNGPAFVAEWLTHSAAICSRA